jgi:asparagine synthase (glutamine-hydrolysing)
MIYVGLLHLNEKSRCEIDENKLVSTLTLYASAPTFLKKQFLTLCYSRRSEQHDKDEVGGNETTLLMGRIFDKASSSVLKLNDFEVLSGRTKEEALEKIWGKYVYIKGNQEGSEFEVVIDSTGQLPFFYYFLPNGDVLFSSDIEILFKVLSQKPVLNWAYLSSFILYGNSSAIITAFKNVFELPPGCCLKLTKNEHKTELFWNPLSSNKPFLHPAIVLTF